MTAMVGGEEACHVEKARGCMGDGEEGVTHEEKRGWEHVPCI